MDKEKQIEEMVCNACITKPTCTDIEKAKCMRRNFAICVIKQGYRKQKEGEWVTSDIPQERYVCSVCGGACWYYDYQGDVAKSRYCPNCGAHMRKEDEGEMKINAEDIKRIIAYKKERLEHLAKPEVWHSYTKNMECGEYKEFKQSCVDNEIIIEALERMLSALPTEKGGEADA